MEKDIKIAMQTLESEIQWIDANNRINHHISGIKNAFEELKVLIDDYLNNENDSNSAPSDETRWYGPDVTPPNLVAVFDEGDMEWQVWGKNKVWAYRNDKRQIIENKSGPNKWRYPKPKPIKKQ